MRKRKAPSHQTIEDSSVCGGLNVSNMIPLMLNSLRSRCVVVNPTWLYFCVRFQVMFFVDAYSTICDE